MYFLESPQRGDSNKYTKHMIHKKTFQKYPLFMLFNGSTSSFFYNSNLTAKSLVTNSVFIARVLCSKLSEPHWLAGESCQTTHKIQLGTGRFFYCFFSLWNMLKIQFYSCEICTISNLKFFPVKCIQMQK